MIFLINLDSASNRRAHMQRQIAGTGLAWERVGCDFRSWSRPAIDAWVRDRMPMLAFDHDALSSAEIGCWASHLTAWRSLLASPLAPAAIVLEDDIVLAASFREAVEQLTAQPSGYDVVLLGTSSRNLSKRRSTPLGRFTIRAPVGVVYNTWGYGIARPWVDRFFAQPSMRIAMPIDHFLGGRPKRMRPHLGVIDPPVVDEAPELAKDSQIAPYTFRLDRARIVELARRRMLRSRLGDLYSMMHRWL